MTGDIITKDKGRAVQEFEIQAHGVGGMDLIQDHLAVEEPLEIQIVTQTQGKREKHSLAVTMRTPGHDVELALGFLLTENVITDWNWIRTAAQKTPGAELCNVVRIFLKEGVPFDAEKHSRHVFTSSSCGICGKQTIDQIKAVGYAKPVSSQPVSKEILLGLPRKLREAQAVFESTGGLHAAALFNMNGELLFIREDVGRHNALDKVIGGLFLSKSLPATDTVLMLSGRLSFELVQKAVFAGIPSVAAVGAPSSLAVSMAEEAGVSLYGFLRDGRFNRYTGFKDTDF